MMLLLLEVLLQPSQATLAYSTNGTLFSNGAGSFSEKANAVIFAAQLGIWVAVGKGGTRPILWSADGVTWSATGVSFADSKSVITEGFGICFGGGVFVVIGDGPKTSIVISSDPRSKPFQGKYQGKKLKANSFFLCHAIRSATCSLREGVRWFTRPRSAKRGFRFQGNPFSNEVHGITYSPEVNLWVALGKTAGKSQVYNRCVERWVYLDCSSAGS